MRSVSEVHRLLSAAAAFVVGLLGGSDALLKALVTLMVLDFVLGFGLAWRRRDLSSQVMADALWRKLSVFVAVAVAHAVDQMAAIGARNLTVGYLGIKEALSCLEHIRTMGVAVPTWLVGRLRGALDEGSLKGEHAEGGAVDAEQR